MRMSLLSASVTLSFLLGALAQENGERNSLESYTPFHGLVREETLTSQESLPVPPLDADTFRWDGRQKGCMTPKDIQAMKEGRYKYIFLSYVWGDQFTSEFFYRNHLIVSPRTFPCDRVEILSMGMCGLRDENIKDMGSFQNLRSLLLPANGIGIEGVRKIIQVTQLEIINVDANKLDDDSLRLLSRMPHLKELSVACHSQITDEGTIYLPENRVLEKLNIESTHISSRKCAFLRKTGLKILYFPDSIDLLD